MLPIRRSTSASATWLVRHVENMARKLGSRKVSGAADRKILEGYLLEARKNGKVLKATILDLPGYLMLIGRYFQPSGALNRDRTFVQVIGEGRDAYIPSRLDSELEIKDDPLVLAGPLRVTRLGVVGAAGEPVATRYWGQGVPFVGVGAVHLYSAMYGAPERWPMAYSHSGEAFVWRLVVQAPSVVRWVTDENGTRQVPADPQSAAAGWTLEIGEGALTGGATAITRLLDAPVVDFELNWEGAQYPWIVAGRPVSFTTPTGELGYRVTVACHVTYEPAGPYYYFGVPERPVPEDGFTAAWSEKDNGSSISGGVPSGAKGVWAADIEVVGPVARVVNSYKVFGGDVEQTPVERDHRAYEGVDYTWYLNNLVYRAPMATLENDDGTRTSVMISCSFVETTEDSIHYPDVQAFHEFKGSLFTDITWFDNGVVRRQNMTTTEMTRGTWHNGQGGMTYNGANIAFDLGDAQEDRFTIGADTDGKVVVFPVFSSFKPGDFPLLRVYVASRDGVRLGYSGTPGFAMCVARGAGEQTIFQYGEVDFGPPDAPLPSPKYGEWITLPAPYDHVTYIGNQRYMFYVSHELSSRPGDNYFWAPAGTIAVATYSAATDEVRLEGVIDSELRDNGFGAPGAFPAADAWDYVSTTGAYTVPVFADPAKLGRIEVVRPEGDGYDPGDPNSGGHPATLIASEGKGQPGINLVDWDSNDIKQGRTWISYDSGKTWTQILSYGSPVGAFHAGNAAQARTEPVVRV